MIYVTEMDVDDASFRQVVADLTERYGKKIAPHFQPIRENEKLVGYINIIKNAGRRYTGIGQREECEIPDYCMPNLEILRDSLMEAVAETSEEFMERYFNGEEFSIEEIRAAMRTEVMDGDIVQMCIRDRVYAAEGSSRYGGSRAYVYDNARNQETGKSDSYIGTERCV